MLPPEDQDSQPRSEVNTVSYHEPDGCLRHMPQP